MLGAAVVGLHYRYPAPTDFPAAQAGSILIAHAGGAIDGQTYTDSREAVEASIVNGFKFIELDLLLTADQQIVAGHDWEYLNSQLSLNGDEARSLTEVKEGRILGRYTPLDNAGINAIFLKHPDLYLVTDKLNDFDQIKEQLTIPQDRLFVEVFSYEKYARALRQGIKYPMLCMRSKEKLTEFKYDYLFRLGRVRMITIPAEIIPEAETELSELLQHGVRIFAYSSNNIPFMSKYLGKCVSGFYTDTVYPSRLQGTAVPE